MTIAFITGVSGFAGQHLAKLLLSKDWEVSGLDIHPASALSSFYHADITDRVALEQALDIVRPDVVFHLAGVLKSEKPDRFYAVHVLGTTALLDAIANLGLQARTLIASSSAVYGAGLGRRPITENFMPRPITHYALSKLAQEMVASYYHTTFNLPILYARTFNLLGSGLSQEMSCSSFARQIAQAEIGNAPATIQTGDLSPQRDFVDVRDAVRAYMLLVEQGQAGQVYNVASGQTISIRQCLDFLRKQARIPIGTVLDPARIQKNDIPIQVGSAKFIKNEVNWEAKIPSEESLLDLLNDWRRKVNKNE